jgi:integrase/recombinase XerD
MNCSTTSFCPTTLRWLRDGSLAGCEAPYRRWLDERGYADRTAHAYLFCLAHFARWATERDLTCATLSSASIARFLDEHLPCCDCPRPAQRHRPQVRAALRQLQPALRAAGVTVIEVEPTAIECELERYDAYLRDRCGLAANTRLNRRQIIRRLLELPADGTGRHDPSSPQQGPTRGRVADAGPRGRVDRSLSPVRTAVVSESPGVCASCRPCGGAVTARGGQARAGRGVRALRVALYPRPHFTP